MPEFRVNEDAPVMVEFTDPSGVREVSLSPDDLAEKSEAALDSAMNTVHHMARRVVDTVDSLITPPSSIEVSFGLKLDVEAGAIITKAGADANLNVTLKWETDPFEGMDDYGDFPLE